MPKAGEMRGNGKLLIIETVSFGNNGNVLKFDCDNGYTILII